MSHFLLREPRILILSIVMILAAGVSSFIVVPRMEDPLLTKRGAIVTTPLGGADATRVESLVTDVVVNSLREFDEIKELHSTSRPGISTVGVVLKDEITDVDEVWARIRDRLSDARADLPRAALPPHLDVQEARAYSFILALKVARRTEASLSSLARWASECEDVLRAVSNTEIVDSFGAPDEEVLVEVDQNQLTQLGLTIPELAQQLALSDAKVSAGKIHGPQTDTLLEVSGEFDSLGRIESTVINSSQSGQTAYLSDIAQVYKALRQPPSSAAIVDGVPAIILAAAAAPDARLDLWTGNLRSKIEQFADTLPSEIESTILFEQATYVDNRMHQLLTDLGISSLCVVTVVLLMMGWRSALIVGSALPLAACLVFFSLNFLGIPFHQMSLSGLVIALGMLEGCAIIIVDEVQRRLELGDSRGEAVTHAIGHMTMPLFGATATTVISFLPIATMPGPSGEFVGTIGVSVILALIAAFGLSLSIIPALSALTASTDGSQKHGFWRRGIQAKQITTAFRSFVTQAFKRPWRTAAAGLLVCLPGFALLPFFDVQFFPGADRNQFHIEMQLSPQASLGETEKTALQVRELLLKHPEVQRVDWVLGESAPSFYYNMIGRVRSSARYGQALITLTPETDTSHLINQIQGEVDSEIPGAQVRVLQLQQGPPFNAPIEVQVFGTDLDTLRGVGNQVRELLSQHPDVTHVQTDLTDQLPKLAVKIKEEEARLFGISLSGVSRQLDAALEGVIGGSFLDGSEELPVRVRLAGDFRGDLQSIQAVELLPETPAPRTATRLDSLATIELTSEPALVSRFNDRQMNEVRGYLRADVLPSKVLGWFKQQQAAGKLELPPGYSIEFGGEASKRSEAVGQLLSRITMLVAAATFVLVLSIRSYRGSLVVVVVAVCSCGVAFTALFISGFPLGFTGIVGMMGMVGVAINDSMVVLAELRTDEKARHGAVDDVVEVIMRSSRHVLSTTLTVGCSFIPMIIGGGTFWPPMAMVVVGGVFGATISALIWIPAVHRILCKAEQPA